MPIFGDEGLMVAPGTVSATGFSVDDPTCVFAFEFENNSNDLSGNGHSITVGGNVSYSDGSVNNKWVHLDGSGSTGVITITDATDLDNMSALTISAWIKESQTDSNNVLISKRDSWSATGIPYEINIESGTGVSFRVIGNDPLNTGAVFTADTLHHIACTWDGTTARIYIDGTQSTSGTRSGTLTANSQNVVIGALPDFGEVYVGKVDRLFLFSEAKSAADILDEYNAYL